MPNTPHPDMNLPAPDDATLPDQVQRLGASVMGIALRRGSASASAVAWRDGVAVTTAGAVWRHGRVQLVLPGGDAVEGTVRGVDPATDLAAIGYAATPLPAAPRADGATSPRAGDFVCAVGRESSGLLHASFGHVGAAGGAWRSWRGGRIDSLVRLDGGLYPGLEGAAVADAAGACLGIASSAFSRHHGVVLPAATIDRVLDALLAHGRVPQGYLGIAAQPVRAVLDGSATAGLLVSSVADDGPAAAAGVLVGDVIVQAAGQPVAGIDALRELLGSAAVGGQVALRVARGGRAVDLAAAVAERPRRGCH